MRFLVGPDQPGERDDDATRTWPGEPLGLPVECDSPCCDCSELFVGLASGHYTSTAQVGDVEADEAVLVEQARAAAARTIGIPPGHVDLAEAREVVGLITRAAQQRPPGTIVRTGDLPDLPEQAP